MRAQANPILSDIIKIIFAILLPPLGVFLERGCGADLLINILLTVLGYIPGIIHALYVSNFLAIMIHSEANDHLDTSYLNTSARRLFRVNGERHGASEASFLDQRYPNFNPIRSCDYLPRITIIPRCASAYDEYDGMAGLKLFDSMRAFFGR